MRAPTPDTAAIALPDWLPPPVQQHVRELMEQLGTPGPGRAMALPEHLEILQQLVTAREMRTIWQRLQRRAKSESALAEFLDCMWQNAVLTPPLQTPDERLTLIRLWRQEQESLRLTNPELAQHCVPVSVYFDQVKRDLGASNSPLLVKKHRRQYGDDPARAYVRLVSTRARELFGAEVIGLDSLVTIVQVAFGWTIDKRQAQRWLAD